MKMTLKFTILSTINIIIIKTVAILRTVTPEPQNKNLSMRLHYNLCQIFLSKSVWKCCLKSDHFSIGDVKGKYLQFLDWQYLSPW